MSTAHQHAGAPAQPPDERQQRDGSECGDLLYLPMLVELNTDPGRERLSAAGPTVLDVVRERTAVSQAQLARGPVAPRVEHRPHVLATPAAREIVELLRQPSTGAEQGALDDHLRHPELIADLAVGEALELAQDDDLVVAVREAAESPAQVVELLFGLDDDFGRRRRRQRSEPAVDPVALDRDLGVTTPTAVFVDARVPRDLVDPRTERDRPVVLPQPA